MEGWFIWNATTAFDCTTRQLQPFADRRTEGRSRPLRQGGIGDGNGMGAFWGEASMPVLPFAAQQPECHMYRRVRPDGEGDGVAGTSVNLDLTAIEVHDQVAVEDAVLREVVDHHAP